MSAVTILFGVARLVSMARELISLGSEYVQRADRELERVSSLIEQVTAMRITHTDATKQLHDAEVDLGDFLMREREIRKRTLAAGEAKFGKE